MRPTPWIVALAAAALAVPAAVRGQAPGRFPPDSLVNVRVIPRTTRVIDVVGQMRNITGDLGVRCQFCHIGEEGMPLERFDFASDERRTKRVAREMMRMVQTINSQYIRQLPERTDTTLLVTCATCHHGTARPMPLYALLLDVATRSGADSAIRAYRALRARYYGRDAYDFGETSLNIAAFRLARQNRFDEAFALLRLNEEQFPAAASPLLFRGNILLMRADTNGAAAAFQEALRREPAHLEAAGRLRGIGRPAR